MCIRDSAITAAVPMIMAKAVNKDLSKLVFMESKAELTDSSMIIF